jgi:FKBP-type peptidyl-prolyl cis-trans isomerase FklB
MLNIRTLAFCGLGLWAVQAVAQTAAPTLSTPKDQMSYASGVSAVRNFTKNDVAFDIELVIQGMRDALAGKALLMNEKQMTTAMNQLQTELRRTMASNHRDLADKNRKRGVEFLVNYKQKPGVLTLSNGVAYQVLTAGTGSRPVESDVVVTRYRGSNIDGVEFDATLPDKTSTLRVSQLIMGWREAIKQMPVGSKWQIVVPSPLAYGERGVGSTIGPNETLVYEIELLEIKK